MRNPYVNSRTNTTEKKKTSGQIDEVEKFVQSDVRKINITDLCTKYWYFKLNPVRFRGHDRSCALKITMPSSGR